MIIYARHDLEDMPYVDSLLAEIDTLESLGAIGPANEVAGLREWISGPDFDAGDFDVELYRLQIRDDLVWMREGPSLWIDDLNYSLYDPDYLEQ